MRIRVEHITDDKFHESIEAQVMPRIGEYLSIKDVLCKVVEVYYYYPLDYAADRTCKNYSIKVDFM